MTAPDPALAVRRFVLVGLALPTLFTAAALLVQGLTAPRLPDPIAIHFGADGVANGFGPLWVTSLATLLLGIGLPTLMTLTALPGLRRGDSGVTYRFLGAIAASSSCLVAVIMTVTMVIQVDLADAAAARLPLVVLPAAVLVAALVGLAAWHLQPEPAVPEQAAGRPVAAYPLSSNQRAVWMRDVTLTGWALAAIGLGTVAVILASLSVWLVAGASAEAWIMTGVAVLMLVLVATTTAFRVRVDSTGLTVRSVLGLPRFHVPLADVASVSVADVNPMGQFGGWGLRSAPGATGIVLRTGEAIAVTRVSGRRFVVTVDDAGTGAALLQALHERATAG